MKLNKWTLGLAAVGVVSLASTARADEKMSQVQTALSNTTLSGYVDTSAMWSLGSQNGGAIPKYTPGGVQSDGFNLNAIDIALDKPLDEGSWSAGYHVELMAGPDAVPGDIVTGIGAGTYSSTAVSVRQAYLALSMPVGNSAIDWKVGVFDTIIGYESSSDPLNPNYTRSYGYQIEPTTHTGILGTYKVNDMISVSAGVANSTQGNALRASAGNPAESQKTVMGAIALTAPDTWGWAKGATLNLGVINAINVQGSTAAGGDKGSTSIYVGTVVPMPLTALKVGAAFDYLDNHNSVNTASAGVAPGFLAANPENNSVWVAAIYGNYQANDKLSMNLRGELVDATANKGNMGEEVTATVSYKLWDNVLSRAEIRWDHADVKAWNNTAANAGPVDKNAILLALNLIYQF